MKEINWIDCNLPFSTHIELRNPYTEKKDYPNLDKAHEKKFGEKYPNVILRLDKLNWNDPEYIEYDSWLGSLPEVVNYYKECNLLHAEIEEDNRKRTEENNQKNPSFCSLGLLKPGVLVEFKNGTVELIGTCDSGFSVCGDFGAEPHGVRVKRYAIVVDMSEFNTRDGQDKIENEKFEKNLEESFEE